MRGEAWTCLLCFGVHAARGCDFVVGKVLDLVMGFITGRDVNDELGDDKRRSARIVKDRNQFDGERQS